MTHGSHPGCSVAFSVPTETPITYPIATIAGGPNPDAAAKFVDFVMSARAQAVLARFGFGKPCRRGKTSFGMADAHVALPA